MKLMIVDDSNIIRRAIEKYLNKLGLELVGKAQDGQEAIELFKVHMPDLVTMDITMPLVDGLACIEALLKMKKETKIIVISALTDPSTGIKALSLGAKAFLPKPFTESQLLSEVELLMRSVQ
jgi:two-component system chemotaxis response regulator CheY